MYVTNSVYVCVCVCVCVCVYVCVCVCACFYVLSTLTHCTSNLIILHKRAVKLKCYLVSIIKGNFLSIGDDPGMHEAQISFALRFFSYQFAKSG